MPRVLRRGPDGRNLWGVRRSARQGEPGRLGLRRPVSRWIAAGAAASTIARAGTTLCGNQTSRQPAGVKVHGDLSHNLSHRSMPTQPPPDHNDGAAARMERFLEANGEAPPAPPTPAWDWTQDSNADAPPAGSLRKSRSEMESTSGMCTGSVATAIHAAVDVDVGKLGRRQPQRLAFVYNTLRAEIGGFRVRNN